MSGKMADEMPDLGPEPWLRLAPGKGRGGKNETARAYAAFREHLHTDPAERSLRNSAASLGKWRSQMSRWSGVFWWTERSAAWDRHQGQLAAAAHERQQLERARQEREHEEVRVKRSKELRQKKWDTAEEVHAIGMRLLRSPFLERKVQKTDESGNQTVNLKPSVRTHEAGRRLVETAFELADQSVRPDTDASPTSTVCYSETYEPVDYKPENGEPGDRRDKDGKPGDAE